MKILVICSINAGHIANFITEQVECIRKTGIIMEYFLIQGKGLKGYIKNLPAFKRQVHTFKPDLIHAHYGLSGLFANLQRDVSVITTFHGTDVNSIFLRPFSGIASLLSKHNVFVSKELAAKSFFKGKYSIIPSGIDLNIFFPIDKTEARKRLNLPINEKLILFAGSFTNHVKNYPLAKASVNSFDKVKLIELSGYSRKEVNLLMNACDMALMTSFHEGSPQFIKEALSCNCPIVSTNVGDVKSILSDIEGCYISTFSSFNVKEKIVLALKFANYAGRTKGRLRIIELNYDIENINKKLIEVFHKALK